MAELLSASWTGAEMQAQEEGWSGEVSLVLYVRKLLKPGGRARLAGMEAAVVSPGAPSRMPTSPEPASTPVNGDRLALEVSEPALMRGMDPAEARPVSGGPIPPIGMCAMSENGVAGEEASRVRRPSVRTGVLEADTRMGSGPSSAPVQRNAAAAPSEVANSTKAILVSC